MGSYLLLLTHAFPYAPPIEEFIENEIGYMANVFDGIFIISTSKTANTDAKRSIESDKVQVRRLERGSKIVEVFKALLKSTIWQSSFYRDLITLVKRNMLFNRTAILQLFLYHTNSYIACEKVLDIFSTLGVLKNDKLVVYSYWLSDLAYAAILIKKNLIEKGYMNVWAVSRAHGASDVFVSYLMGGFKPCLKKLDSQLDIIAPISKKGRDYLKAIGFSDSKLHVSYLGVKKQVEDCSMLRSDVFRITTCSSLTPVKRVSLIVDALSIIKDIPIELDVFGDGPLFSEIKTMCASKLSKNVKWRLLGSVKNEAIITHFKNSRPDIFINVSSMEGIPVSIMEAISFGVPIIATDVGGVSEICIDGFNGVLLKRDFKREDLIEAIKYIYSMKQNAYRAMCEASYSVFRKKFNQERNYKKFVQDVAEMFGGTYRAKNNG
jgi:glycosyltransferase involved in cell wall biosynthesis